MYLRDTSCWRLELEWTDPLLFSHITSFALNLWTSQRNQRLRTTNDLFVFVEDIYILDMSAKMSNWQRAEGKKNQVARHVCFVRLYAIEWSKEVSDDVESEWDMIWDVTRAAMQARKLPHSGESHLEVRTQPDWRPGGRWCLRATIHRATLK